MCWKTHVDKCTLSTVTRLETPASNGRCENSVRTMKEIVQCQKDASFSLDVDFSIKHHLFALLVRHVRLEILLRDQRHLSIVSWSVDVMMTTNNHDLKQLGFSVSLLAQMR